MAMALINTHNCTNPCSFEKLTPDMFIAAAEKVLREPMSGLAAPLPSYINRVYELQTAAGRRLIAKFYRPGRWTRDAIMEEHDFVLDCAADDIPVVPPLPLPDGNTLAEENGIFFAFYEKRAGRPLEINEEHDWLRIGQLLGRIHLAGDKRQARHRIVLDPRKTTAKEINYLLDNNLVTPLCHDNFRDICLRILDRITPLFKKIEYCRIHGDFHAGNILTRPGESLMIIDFDDMVTGPAVQDLWLLLPDSAANCRGEIDLLLEGYRQFRDFNPQSLVLIEALRAMRIIYFLSWCATQKDDFKFQHNFPDWGNDAFWRREIADLSRQLEIINAGMPR